MTLNGRSGSCGQSSLNSSSGQNPITRLIGVIARTTQATRNGSSG